MLWNNKTTKSKYDFRETWDTDQPASTLSSLAPVPIDSTTEKSFANLQPQSSPLDVASFWMTTQKPSAKSWDIVWRVMTLSQDSCFLTN